MLLNVFGGGGGGGGGGENPARCSTVESG